MVGGSAGEEEAERVVAAPGGSVGVVVSVREAVTASAAMGFFWVESW